MSKLIVIVGVTGNQGSSVAETFLKDPSWKVRGTSRDSTKPSSQALAAKGVEIVYGDVDDAASLKEAFKGANLIFGNTTFDIMSIAAPSDPTNPNGLREAAFDLEVKQGKNVADAVAFVGDSLELFIWSSLSYAKKRSNGKYSGVYHFDSKATVVEYINEKYPEVAKKTSLLQMGFFLTNWKWGQANFPLVKRSDGSLVLRVPGSGDYPQPFILPSDTGAFVHALSKLPPGKNLMAYTDLLTWEEYVKLWSKVTGVPLTFEKVTVADHAKLAPGGYGEEIAEMFAYAQDFGYWGAEDESVMFAKDLQLDLKITSVEEYMRSEDWSELLNRPASE